MSRKHPDTPKQSEMAGTDTPDRANTNAKLQSLEAYRSDATGEAVSTLMPWRSSKRLVTLRTVTESSTTITNRCRGAVSNCRC